jgi:hypothetical protein
VKKACLPAGRRLFFCQADWIQPRLYILQKMKTLNAFA